MALTGLPRFRCLPEPAGQHRTTIHLLPDERDVLPALSAGFADAQAGRLPDFPAIEWRAPRARPPALAARLWPACQRVPSRSSAYASVNPLIGCLNDRRLVKGALQP